MNLIDLKTVLTTMAKKAPSITPMIWGPHGIGKSSIIRQTAKELGYRPLVMYLSQSEAVDVAGVLYTYVDPVLNMSVTASHPPKWFAEALKQGNVLLFFDEFNLARKEVMNASFPIVLEHTLNNEKLPDSVFIVCAGNPEDERYETTPMTESLIDRFMHILVTRDADCFMSWAKEKNPETNKQNIHPDMISFLSTNKNMIAMEDKRDSEFPVKIRYSERSIERASKIHELQLPPALEVECLRGILGTEAATAFMKSLEAIDKPFTAEQIFSFSEDLAERLRRYKESNPMRADIISESVTNLIEAAEREPKRAESSFVHIKKFMLGLPHDQALRAFQGIHALKGTNMASLIMEDKEMVQFVHTITAPMNTGGRGKGKQR